MVVRPLSADSRLEREYLGTYGVCPRAPSYILPQRVRLAMPVTPLCDWLAAIPTVERHETHVTSDITLTRESYSPSIVRG